jgi:integrase
MSTITADTTKKLIKACKMTELREKAFLDLTFHSGLRPAEACALRWEDVELNRIHVRNGKGGKARTVALAETYGYLESWREVSGGTGYVFATRNGQAWQTSHVRRLFGRLAKRAGVTAHPHGMRHGHALRVWEATKDLGLVNRQLGHARLATTDEYLKARGVNLDAVAALRF